MHAGEHDLLWGVISPNGVCFRRRFIKPVHRDAPAPHKRSCSPILRSEVVKLSVRLIRGITR